MSDPLFWIVVAVVGIVGFIGGLFGNWYDGRERERRTKDGPRWR
jgi:hypothetical protein